jgi:hypothetical protein
MSLPISPPNYFCRERVLENGVSRHWKATHAETSIRAQLLEEGGERMWKAFMAELRSIHMGAPVPRRSVSAELQAPFEAAMRRESNAPNEP